MTTINNASHPYRSKIDGDTLATAVCGECGRGPQDYIHGDTARPPATPAPVAAIIGKALGCYGCDGEFMTGLALDVHVKATGHFPNYDDDAAPAPCDHYRLDPEAVNGSRHCYNCGENHGPAPDADAVDLASKVASAARFGAAWARFVDAAAALSDAWEGEHFWADEEFGPFTGEHFPLFPMSLDEWVEELRAFTLAADAGIEAAR